jgi:hypothetical protein
MPKTKQVLETPTIFNLRDRSDANVAAMYEFYEEHGYLCSPLLSAEECKDNVCELWDKVILPQPLLEEYHINVRGSDGMQLDPKRKEHRDEFFKAVASPLSPATRKTFTNGWPLHLQFGACADNEVWHLEGTWGVRQDPDLYALASSLIGTRDLFVSIDRAITKLPQQGDDKLAHWDANIFYPGEHEEQASAELDSIHGKVCYTHSRVLIAPGTHTKALQSQVRETYKPLYPHVKKKDKLVQLDQNKPDPMGLLRKLRLFRVPAGHVVFWHKDLLHGQKKTPANECAEYGAYISYRPAKPRKEYKEVCGVDELEDRLESFRKGQAPKLYPSLKGVHLYPNQWNVTPQLMKNRIQKMPQGHPMIQERTQKNGVVVKTLVRVPSHNYTPPKLSSLGKRLLGWREDAASGDEGPSKRMRGAD